MGECPICHTEVNDKEQFCPNCGTILSPVDVQKFDNLALNPTEKTTSHQDRNTQTIVDPSKHQPFHLRSLLSELVKRHTHQQAEKIFIVGTDETTPRLDQLSLQWEKPWLYSRVLGAFLVAFLMLIFIIIQFQNENSIPGLIFVGAFAVPFSGMIFFFELNILRNLSIFEIFKIFFIGGIFSIFATLFMYQFVTFSHQEQVYNMFTLSDALTVGVVEEVGKLVITVYFIHALKAKYILNGLLIGGAVGAGFAAFETAGYIYNGALREGGLVEIAVLRGWTAVGGHLVWAAIAGGALLLVKNKEGFKWQYLFRFPFLLFLALTIVLHGVWDLGIVIAGRYYIMFIILIVIAWLAVLYLLKRGLKELHLLDNQ